MNALINFTNNLKKIEIEVSYKYTIELDETNEIVKEYESENDLIVELASYKFSEVLPVMKAIKVKDIELISVS